MQRARYDRLLQQCPSETVPASRQCAVEKLILFLIGSLRSVEAALREFEKEMSERSRRKVLKSREAASLLHQPAAVLAVGNITRARAAEDFDGR